MLGRRKQAPPVSYFDRENGIMMKVRARLDAFLSRAAVRQVIIGVIIFNAILLGMETSGSLMARFGGLIIALDTACLVFFVI